MYSIKNPNSDAPAEIIDQATYDAMSASRMILGFEVEKVKTPARPTDLDHKPAKATADAK